MDPLFFSLGHVNSCGSGEVTHFIKRRLLPHAVMLATDVNTLAITKTQSFSSSCSVPSSSSTTPSQDVDTLLADMFTCFNPQRTHFDLVVFNPPYVPTEDDELQRALRERDISASWAGGRDGRVVIDRFLDAVPAFLAGDDGKSIVYLVVLQDNKPYELMREMTRRYAQLECRVCAQRSAGMESLYVLRMTSHSKKDKK